MIKLKNIEKFFDTGITKTFVLRQINLDIKEGDFVTIMGPSGAGKSTLLSILGMLDAAWTGEFNLYDHAVHNMKPRHRVELNKEYIGFVFQQYHLLDNLTVYENLDIPLSYRNIKKSERASIVADTLDRFQMVGKKPNPSNATTLREMSSPRMFSPGAARSTEACPKFEKIVSSSLRFVAATEMTLFTSYDAG